MVCTESISKALQLRFSCVSDEFSKTPSSKSFPPSSPSRLSLKMRVSRDEFNFIALPKYLPPSAWMWLSQRLSEMSTQLRQNGMKCTQNKTTENHWNMQWRRLPLIEELRYGLHSSVSNLVVGEIKRGDSRIALKSSGEDACGVVIKQVAWKCQNCQCLRNLERIRQRRHVIHFHPKQRALIRHANLLHAVGHIKMTKRRHVLKEHFHVQM
mmetsp:Transcript_39141/g.88911  ORF Transcript_39141/g.88911 Transcript_39141/m.88911 type:complete len:211 (-) Transcript_39141:459-1091(-)